MTYRSRLTVRTYECDSYGHVNNAIYLHYLEYARMDYLRQIGFAYADVVAHGYSIYVSHIDIYYKHSAVMDDELVIESCPVKLGAVSGTMHQTVKKAADGTVCAEADVTWASVKEGKPTRLPPEFMVDGLRP